MAHKKLLRILVLVLLSVSLWAYWGAVGARVLAQQDWDPNPNPPANPVKLIFVHHSTGGNWLADPNDDQPYGGLGAALRDNNYFVSATNYGWGPYGIGDRTDIINWPEWFTGPNRETILQALYDESGQNVGGFGAWSRMGTDPGGENQIVIFKSCFPNSDLYGSPDDPPDSEVSDQYTVGNAKAVYNRLLTYLQTRQDKLFVVITAPPLQKSDYGFDLIKSPASRAANARAFNDWLVDEWLAGYPYHNVAVFDYYNVLTSNAGNPETSDAGQEGGNHHRWHNGAIEHSQGVDNDFSAYPSGDSHPSTAGHTKATSEFVPLLNVFYHRWQDTLGEAPPAVPTPTPTTAAAEATPTTSPSPTPSSSEGDTAKPAGVIEDWEGENWWEAYGDGQGSTVSQVLDTAIAHGGQASLRIEYDIVAEGWGDCGTSFEEAQDWRAGDGIELWLRADAAGQPVELVLFSGMAEMPTPFIALWETSAESVDGWMRVNLPWHSFERAEWADEGGLGELDAGRITGLGFNFVPGKGTLWVDDMALYTGEVPPPPGAQPPTATPETVPETPPTATAAAAPGDEPTATPEPPPEPTPVLESESAKRGLCASGAILPLLAALVWAFKRR